MVVEDLKGIIKKRVQNVKRLSLEPLKYDVSNIENDPYAVL